MKNYFVAILAPPLGACCYARGTHCAAPISVFWLFGVVSLIYSFIGGPLNESGISWYTFGLGILMWAISAVWAVLSIKGVEANQCRALQNNPDRQTSQLDESDPLDATRRV